MKKLFAVLFALQACTQLNASVEVGPSPCVYNASGYLQCILGSYSVTWPAAQGVASSLLLNDGSGNLSWSTSAAFVNPMTSLGDIIFENASSSAVRLAGNTTTTREFMAETGTGVISASPSWVQLSAADILAGTLPVSRGGTGLTSGTSGGIPGFTASGSLTSSNAMPANGVLFGGGAGFTPGATAAGTGGQVLVTPSGGGAPVFGQVILSSGAAVTGALVVANGGTGLATIPTNGVLVGAGTSNVTTAAGTAGQVLVLPSGSTAPTFGQVILSSGSAVTGALAVANGGTGLATIPTSGVVVGAGTANVTTATGTAGQVLVLPSGSTAPTFGQVLLSSGSAVTGTLKAANGGTGADTSASTGLAKVSSGTWSVATLVNADVSSSAAITGSKITNVTQSVAGVVSGAGQLLGTNTNDTAVAGNVGELVTCSQTSGGLGAGTGNFAGFCSVPLTAGDWDLSLTADLTGNGSGTTFTLGGGNQLGIGTVSGSATGITFGVNRVDWVWQAALTATTGDVFTASIARYSVSLTGSQTYYANGLATYSTNAPLWYGTLSARRMR